LIVLREKEKKERVLMSYRNCVKDKDRDREIKRLRYRERQYECGRKKESVLL
jgi:hypothetical protein